MIRLGDDGAGKLQTAFTLKRLRKTKGQGQGRRRVPIGADPQGLGHQPTTEGHSDGARRVFHRGGGHQQTHAVVEAAGKGIGTHPPKKDFVGDVGGETSGVPGIEAQTLGGAINAVRGQLTQPGGGHSRKGTSTRPVIPTGGALDVAAHPGQVPQPQGCMGVVLIPA